MKILIATQPLHDGNALRGVGVYTRFLVQELKQLSKLEVSTLEDIKTSKQALKDFDLLHYPFFDFFKPTLPFHHPIPTVVTIHDATPFEFPDAYPVGFRGKLAFWYQKASLSRVKAVITDSEFSKLQLQTHLRLPESKINVTYLAGNPEVVQAWDSEIRKVSSAYSLPKKYLLYVGDINYNKNLPQLIKALKYLPDDLNLVLVGKNFVQRQIPEWKAIQQQIIINELQERITFITSLDKDASADLSAIYSGALAYVQPSLSEGFGLPVLEAMQANTPVVCTKVGSLPEVAGTHATFIKQPEALEIAEAVKKIMSWPNTSRIKNVTAAYEWSQSFTWKKTAEATMSIYTAVLGKK